MAAVGLLASVQNENRTKPKILTGGC